MKIPEVINVKSLPHHSLKIKFENGEEKYLDVNPYLKYPVYEILKDEKIFSLVYVCNGTICWGENGEIDIAPHRVWLESVSQEVIS